MSIITNIKLNGNDADIYIDNEFYNSLSYFVVRANRLNVGQEIDLDKLDNILMESDMEKASEYAYRYLAKYSCTKSKLIKKLKEKTYCYTVAKAVADKLEDNGYIDDYAYAERFAEAKSKVWGRGRIKSELINKGVPSSIIEETLAELDDDVLLESAKLTAQKWYNTHNLDDRKDVDKFYRFMSYRGFGYGMIMKCKDWLLKGEDEYDD